MSNLVRRMAIVERLFKICEEDPFGDRLCANDQNAILTAAHTLSQMGAEQETVSDERDGAVAERSAARSEPSTAGWLPISTAPKDGTEIWAYTTEGYQRVVHWQEDQGPSSDDPGHDAGWASDCGGTYPGFFYHEPQPPHDPPLHWMPLPPAPSQEGASEALGEPKASEHQSDSPAALDARTLEAAAKVADEYAAKTPDSSLRIGAQWIAQDIRALTQEGGRNGD
jgi:hypothetical protein